MTSNNNVILQNALRTPEQHHLLENRLAFEDAVRRMPSGGLQFIVTGEPENEDGAWVIQKQQRTVRPGLEDEIEVVGTYWVVGDRIFMAPSTADILGNRIVCINLTFFFYYIIISALIHTDVLFSYQ